MRNPQYPHYVVVYREKLDTASVDQEMVKDIVHRSVCNSHPTTGGRYTRGEVNLSNFVMNMPRHTKTIVAGDKLELTLPDRTVIGDVVDSIVSNMTAYIFYNEYKQ